MANKWYTQSGFMDDVVISTRVRLARNITGFEFPGRLTTEKSRELTDKISEVLSQSNYGFDEKDIGSLDDVEKNYLIEEYVISKNMLNDRISRKVFMGDDGHVSIMANEEDHLRLQCIYSGFEAQKAYDLINKVDTLIGEKLTYAFSEKYGYLTACPTNVGTGMRVSFMMHLPALALTGHLDDVFSAIGKLGVAVRGIHGEGSKSTGHIYQISNQVTLGLSEEEIIDKLSGVVNQIISSEKELRNKIMKENGEVFSDKIMRSYGILKYAQMLSHSELLDLLSRVRLGVSLGKITDVKLSRITEIMIKSQIAHIISGEPEALNPSQRDIKRAKVVKDLLSEN